MNGPPSAPADRSDTLPPGVCALLRRFSGDADHALRQIGAAPDALHDFRVALRSWLKACRAASAIDATVMQELSQLAASTNSCRDLEVFQRWLRDQPATPADYLADIDSRLTRQRRETGDDIRQLWPAIRARLPTGAVSAWRSDEVDLRELIRPALERNCAKLRTRLQRLIDHPDSAERFGKLEHRCRLSVKQIRYLLEPLCDPGDHSCRQCLRELKQLQDRLGHYHDLCLFTAILQQAQRWRNDLNPLRAAATP